MDRLETLIPLVLMGLLFVALGVPLALGKVPPNPWYGFRVAKTLRSRELWYASNAHGGWLMIRIGVLNLAVALALLAVPGWQPGRIEPFVAAFLLLGAFAIVLLWYLHLRTLPDPDPRK
jgi:uncharacterized membrane protein